MFLFGDQEGFASGGPLDLAWVGRNRQALRLADWVILSSCGGFVFALSARPNLTIMMRRSAAQFRAHERILVKVYEKKPALTR
jgi:hypothetical protein